MSPERRHAALWGGRRAPVTLLGGYLGSGKTTLLNELLASADRRYAVLVNDIGAVNVDAALIARRDGDTLELTDGCVCCSLVDGFAVAFEQLRERPEPPDHVLVELSGVADPARVVPWCGTAGFRLDGVLVLFDAENGLERARDRFTGDTVERQVRAADLLVLTKRDLVDDATEQRVRERLAQWAPRTPVVSAQRGRLPAEWLTPAPVADARPDRHSDAPLDASLHAHAEADETPLAPPTAHRVTHLRVTAPVSREDVTRWLDSLPPSVVRVKGFVPGPAGPLWVEAVGRRSSVRDADSAQTDAEAFGVLVVIGTAELDPAAVPPCEAV